MDAHIEIAPVTAEDANDVRRLARLENRHEFPGAALVARVDGRAIAADGSDAVADPWLPTAAIVRALRALVAGRGPDRARLHEAHMRRRRLPAGRGHAVPC